MENDFDWRGFQPFQYRQSLRPKWRPAQSRVRTGNKSCDSSFWFRRPSVIPASSSPEFLISSSGSARNSNTWSSSQLDWQAFQTKAEAEREADWLEHPTETDRSARMRGWEHGDS